jgi:phosphonatase-like hydrolase
MFELVVFDIAGTTVYDGDAVNATFRAALARAGIAADPVAVNAVMGLPKPEAIRILLSRAGRSVSEEQAQAIHDDFVRRMIEYYATNPSVREIPGASTVFSRLRQAGIKVALNTGFSKSVTEVLLTRLGWTVPAVIDAVVSSDEVTRGRPYPDMIQYLMGKLAIHDTRRVVKVGDTKADLEEGTNAGCGLVVGVCSGASTREQLLAWPHRHIVESVVDLPAILNLS